MIKNPFRVDGIINAYYKEILILIYFIFISILFFIDYNEGKSKLI